MSHITSFQGMLEIPNDNLSSSWMLCAYFLGGNVNQHLISERTPMTDQSKDSGYLYLSEPMTLDFLPDHELGLPAGLWCIPPNSHITKYLTTE